jgi:hypothetical protein
MPEGPRGKRGSRLSDEAENTRGTPHYQITLFYAVLHKMVTF